jgi:hypothetical protein
LWVAIRVFGLYLLVLALISFAKVAYSGLAWMSFIGWSEQYADYIWSTLFDGVVSVAIFGVAGYHLVRKGEWLHRLLMKTGASNSAD